MQWKLRALCILFYLNKKGSYEKSGHANRKFATFNNFFNIF